MRRKGFLVLLHSKLCNKTHPPRPQHSRGSQFDLKFSDFGE
jgi:hypothetical protein